MTQILNIAGYKFISLTDLSALRVQLLMQAVELELKGTILLSQEGINLSLAGAIENSNKFIAKLHADARFADITFRQSYSAIQPFKYMKVKLKKEIITLKQHDIQPEQEIAPAITPTEFKQWLDEHRDITVLDTRNDYEVRFGTFKKAVNLHINDFSEFPTAMAQVPKDKPVVMFCTGGIRCEKAAWVMLKAGYQNVFQLHGGILNYFAEVGGEHYQDDCFVFDQRVALDNKLQETGTVQCRVCHGPVKQDEQAAPGYIPDVSCPSCVNHF